MQLLDQVLTLEKFPGKGGWTYVRLPALKYANGKPLGWDKVRVIFDTHEVPEMGLLSLGNGQRFLPMKAEIRKIIKKEAGEQIRLQVFALTEEVDVRAEFMLCLEDEPEALRLFHCLTSDDKEKCLSWIERGQTTEQQIERMAQAIERILAGVKEM